MHFLKESIGSITYQDNYENAYENVLSIINKLGVAIEKHDKHSGIIVVRWIAKIVNMIFWQCYSDKILLEIREVDENMTKVNIFAIPNLFRIRVRKGEKMSDPQELVLYLQGTKKTA